MGHTRLSKILGVKGIVAGIVAASLSGVVPLTSMASSPASATSSLDSMGLAAGVSPGTVTGMSDTALSALMSGVASSGSNWVRLGSSWPTAQPSAGSYNWIPFDRVINAALGRGLQVLYVIGGTAPGWAQTSSGSPDPSKYAAYAAAATARYSPKGVHAYEIWNEQNLGRNWNATSGASASQYSVLLGQAYTAVKGADPQSLVISGGLSPAGTGGGNVSPKDFLLGMYASGARGSFDAVGTHPYCWPAAPTDALSWSFFYNLPTWIYQVMASNGDGAKKVWMTEFGYPTGYYSNAVTAQQQATYTTSAFEQAKQWSWAGPLFVYNWQDGTDGAWDTFGLLYSDGTAKPALASFASEARSLGQIVTAPSAPTNLHASVGGSTVTLAWTNPSGATGIYVYRDGTKVATLGVVATWQNAKVSQGTHTYYVVAYNAAGTSPASNSVTVNVSKPGNRH